MSAAPAKRSVHVWVVIALTLAAAGYYIWELAVTATFYTSAGAWGLYPAYLVYALYIVIFVVAAGAVYRGYRWIFFFYLLCAVVAAFSLALFVLVLMPKAVALIGSATAFGTTERQMVFAAFFPIIQFVIALYSAIVTYLKIYAVRPPAQSGSEIAGEEQGS